MISKITAKNFMSWESLEFNVTDGVTHITGWNHADNTSEACGKSAIFNALCWGLFGFTAKDTAIDDVIKDGHKSCNVYVTLEDGTVIERSRKPNDLAIWGVAAAEPTRGKDAKETQKMIEQLLGFSYETFLQSCYFAQNGQVKFLSANEENKAKILADLADLSVFDAARKKAHDSARELNLLILQKNSSYLDRAKNVELLTNQIKLMHDTKSKLHADKQQVLQELQTQINELTTQIQYLDVTTPTLSKEYFDKKAEISSALISHREVLQQHKTQLSMQAHLKMQKHVIEKEIKDLQKEASAFSVTNKDGACPTCGTHVSHISEDKRKAIIKEYRGKIDAKIQEFSTIDLGDINEVQQNCMFYEKVVNEIEADLKSIEQIEVTQKAQKDKITFLVAQREKLNDRLNKEKTKDIADIDGRIKLLEKTLQEHKEVHFFLGGELENLKYQVDQFDTLKDGFREVKMWAFQDILSELNSRANGYLNDLFEQKLEIIFTNTEGGEISKIKTLVSIDGEQRALGLFSGGQTRRIMLAVDLALSDIAQSRSSKPLNLLILDEYFKDLSEGSMERIFRLLESRKGAILLVEHNSLFDGLATQTFDIEYKDGISRAKDLHE